jgi:hypothetical protein
MRKLTVQLKDTDGNIKDEKEISVDENEFLIMKYPETMTMERAHRCFEGLGNALVEGKLLIGLPEGINFEVIKIK